MWRGNAIERTEFTWCFNLNDPEEMRNFAYQYLLTKDDCTPLILFDGKTLTVDEANTKYSMYAIEDDTRLDDLKSSIKSAKEYIRSKYPNEVV